MEGSQPGSPRRAQLSKLLQINFFFQISILSQVFIHVLTRDIRVYVCVWYLFLTMTFRLVSRESLWVSKVERPGRMVCGMREEMEESRLTQSIKFYSLFSLLIQ